MSDWTNGWDGSSPPNMTLLQVEGRTQARVYTSPGRLSSPNVVCVLSPSDVVIFLGEKESVMFAAGSIHDAVAPQGTVWLKVLTNSGVGWCRAFRLQQLI